MSTMAKQIACKLCGMPFTCDNGMWFTTCTCARDRPEELRLAQEKFDKECPMTNPPTALAEKELELPDAPGVWQRPFVHGSAPAMRQFVVRDAYGKLHHQSLDWPDDDWRLQFLTVWRNIESLPRGDWQQVALIASAESLERVTKERDEARARLLTAAGDDLCRLSQEEIKAMSAGAVKIPPKDEFLASCERFHAQVTNEAGVNHNCLTLAQLIAENERQRLELAHIKELAKVLELLLHKDKDPSHINYGQFTVSTNPTMLYPLLQAVADKLSAVMKGSQ